MSSMPNVSWVTNFTDNPLKYFFYSYDMFIGLQVFLMIVFGVIGISIYVHSNHNLSITIGYFLLVQSLLLVALPSTFVIVSWIIVSMMAAVYAYNTYFKKG